MREIWHTLIILYGVVPS